MRSKSSSGILYAGPINDLQVTLDEMCDVGYDFIAVPLFTDDLIREARHRHEYSRVPLCDETQVHISRNTSDGGPKTDSFICVDKHRSSLSAHSRWTDMALPSADWSSKIVSVVKLGDGILSSSRSSQQAVMDASTTACLRYQLDLAIHLSTSATIIPLMSETHILFLASVLNSYLTHNSHIRQIWMRIPLTTDNDADKQSSSSRSWNWWNQFRSLIDYDARVSVVLDLSDATVRYSLPHPAELARWHGEPVKCVLINEKLFQINSKGFPVLNKMLKQVMRPLFKLNIQFLVETSQLWNGQDQDSGSIAPSVAPLLPQYRSFIEHLWTTHWTSPSDCGATHCSAQSPVNESVVHYPDKSNSHTQVEGNEVNQKLQAHHAPNDSTASEAFRQFTSGYEDYLQMPLQPLMDNLESATYEVFERDPVKYERYEAAILAALRDMNCAIARRCSVSVGEHCKSSSSAVTNGCNGNHDCGVAPEPSLSPSSTDDVQRKTKDRKGGRKSNADHNKNKSCDVATESTIRHSSDLIAHRSQTSPPPPPVMNVMVLGAGRGPLVQAIINATEQLTRDMKGSKLAFNVRIFAVEKNSHAIHTLQEKMTTDWVTSDVTVVSGDMRHWQPAPAERAHLVISELLGSFGDNELSPECLYGAEHLLADRDLLRDDGLTPICIPTAYHSYIAPVQSAKMFNEVRGANTDFDGSPLAKVGPFETPYVVHLNNVSVLAEPEPLFSFVHPSERHHSFHLPTNDGQNGEGETDKEEILIGKSQISEAYDSGGSRSNLSKRHLHYLTNLFEQVQFDVSIDSVVHGLAGYFDCHLYADIRLSIVPATHSPGMFSWFPIYFPLRTPVPLRAGDSMSVAFWRINNGVKVWYEWTVTQPQTLPIHNPNGRTYTIGL